MARTSSTALPTSGATRYHRTIPYVRLMAHSLRPQRGHGASLTSGLLWPVALFALVLVLWEAYVRAFDVAEFVLPGPILVVEYTVRRFDLFVTHAWPTLYQTVLGFLLAVVGGVLLAIVVFFSEVGRKGIMPLLVVAQIIPKIAIAPLIMLWFGLGDFSRILIAFLIAFFPMVINTASGFQSVGEELHLLGRAFSKTRLETFRKIQLPHALPHIFDGMKISITLAVIGVVVAEFVSSQRGLGYLIIFANGLLDTVMMMASIIVLSVVGIALYMVIAILDRVFVYWRAPADG